MRADGVTVVLGGDTGSVKPFYKIAAREPKYTSFLNLLETSDIVFVNLEGALTDQRYADAPQANKGDPVLAKDYASIGIKIMSIGHKVLDFGPPGLMDSIGALDEAGIKHVGAGRNPADAEKEEIIEVEGQRIGFMHIGVHALGMRRYEAMMARDHEQRPVLEKPGLALIYLKTLYEVDPDRGSIAPRTFVLEEGRQKLIDRIRNVRKNVDFLIVSAHWGQQGDVVFDYQTSLGHAMIDAGADVISGQHPHRPQGVEVYKGRPIFYSLGNFVYQRTGLMDYLGPSQSVAKISIADGQIAKTELIPTICDNTFTSIADLRSRDQFLKRVKELSPQFNTEFVIKDGEVPILIGEM